MTAPFELPDIVDIWNNNDDTLMAESVPCRVVPCMVKQFDVWSSGTDTQVTYISHWVDLEDLSIKMDNSSLIAAAHYSWDFNGGVIIKMNWGGWMLVLRCMWQELRYTRTEKYYHRLYCQRISQTVE